LLSLCALLEKQKTEPENHEFPTQGLTSSYRGYITENTAKEALITFVISVGTGYPPKAIGGPTRKQIESDEKSAKSAQGCPGPHQM
jgi:hypothetical protein